MKQLDRFSRFENAVDYLLAYFVILGAPALAVFLADDLLLKELSPFIRYPLLGVVGMTALLLSIPVLASVEDLFTWFRKTRGMKPLWSSMNEITEERTEYELAAEERRREFFTHRPDAEQRYSIYLLQQKELRRLDDIHTSVEVIKFVLIGVVGGYVLSRLV